MVSTLVRFPDTRTLFRPLHAQRCYSWTFSSNFPNHCFIIRYADTSIPTGCNAITRERMHDWEGNWDRTQPQHCWPIMIHLCKRTFVLNRIKYGCLSNLIKQKKTSLKKRVCIWSVVFPLSSDEQISMSNEEHKLFSSLRGCVSPVNYQQSPWHQQATLHSSLTGTQLSQCDTAGIQWPRWTLKGENWDTARDRKVEVSGNDFYIHKCLGAKYPPHTHTHCYKLSSYFGRQFYNWKMVVNNLYKLRIRSAHNIILIE